MWDQETRARELRAGDLYLARLLGRRSFRWTLFAALFLTATASLYLRVGLGRSEQALPWYGGLLAAYGFGMAAASRDPRCRLAYASFGLLVALTFSRALLAGHARAAGAVEVACSLMALAAMMSLSRDVAFRSKAAMLLSPPNGNDAPEPRREGSRPVSEE